MNYYYYFYNILYNCTNTSSYQESITHFFAFSIFYIRWKCVNLQNTATFVQLKSTFLSDTNCLTKLTSTDLPFHFTSTDTNTLLAASLGLTTVTAVTYIVTSSNEPWLQPWWGSVEVKANVRTFSRQTNRHSVLSSFTNLIQIVRNRYPVSVLVSRSVFFYFPGK